MAKNSEATLLLKIKSAGEGVLSKTKAALGDIRTWATAAFAALTSGAAISAFKESEEATNRLNQSLITQGIYTKGLSASYQQMASNLQSVTTFEDDAIKAAQAQMQAYLGQTKISKELMMLTLDLAAAKRMDLSSAAEMVAKSIGTGTNALARQGIKLSENASQSEKMAQVTQQLSSMFGGQAVAAAKGLGAIDQMKNAFGDLLEVIGERLAPYVIRGAKAITELATSLQSNKTAIAAFDIGLSFIAKSAANVKLQFMVLKDILMGVFSTVYTAITKLAAGDISGAWESIKTGFSQMTENIKGNFNTYLSEIDAINAMASDKRKADEEEEARREVANQENKRNRAIQDDAYWKRYFETKDEEEINRLVTQERLKNDEHLKGLNAEIQAEQDQTKKLELERQKRKYLDEQYGADERGRMTAVERFEKALGDKRIQGFASTMGELSNLQNSKSKEMVAIGKAAALAHIAINTASGAVGAYRSMTEIAGTGPVGVGLGIGAAGALTAYGAERAANVAGIQLAEGGIVKATPGGVHAIIGEGGRDEAVIPLDDRGGALMGTTINLVVEGGFLGDPVQAKEFVRAIDEHLFRLRQANESLAFDRGVI